VHPVLKKFLCSLLTAGCLISVSAEAAATPALPSDKHNRIVIIDAGHGGMDGGAVSPSGLYESTINLEIARKLELILAFFGTAAVMTRTEETLIYSEGADTIHKKKVEDTKRRIELVNATPNAVLLSIHQNIYPSGGPFGSQVLYAKTDGSKLLAENIQQLLITTLNPKNRRKAAGIPSSVMLLNRVSCPAILIECGFLSNTEEERLLQSDSYQLKLAAVIASGYATSEASLMNSSSGGIT
jgi:N-acetylmuramoyl-L-alanine amidase